MNKTVTALPPNVQGLLDCARHQINHLERLYNDSNDTVASSNNENENENAHPNSHGEENKINMNLDTMLLLNDNTDANEKMGPSIDNTKRSISSATTRIATTTTEGLSQDELEDALDDGFMCMDLKTVETKLEKWKELFPQVKPYFAMKCNPDPMVVKWLASHSNQVGFDVASWREIQLALEACGNDTNIMMVVGDGDPQEPKHQRHEVAVLPRLIYANPQRAEQDLKNCMSAYQSLPPPPSSSTPSPLWLTLDGPEELIKIYQISQEQQHFPISRIGLILRILVPDHHSSVPLGEKFGAPLDEINNLVQRGLQLGFQPTNFVGVSFHCGSGCHDPDTYRLALDMTQSALDIIHSIFQSSSSQQQQCQHRCSIIDIGGGFPGWDGLGGDDHRFSSGKALQHVGDGSLKASQIAALQETTIAIANAIQPKLQSLVQDGYHIIAEPGRYFVEASACMVSRIYSKEQTIPAMAPSEEEGFMPIRSYKIAHGVQGVFKDVLLCNENFPPFPLQHCHRMDKINDHNDGCYDSKTDDTVPLFPSRVLGPSFSSAYGKNDVVCASCELPELQIGDWLVFDRMGAYTLSIASRAGRPVICYVQ